MTYKRVNKHLKLISIHFLNRCQNIPCKFRETNVAQVESKQGPFTDSATISRHPISAQKALKHKSRQIIL